MPKTPYLLSYPGPSWQIRGGVNFRSEARPSTNPRAAMREWLVLADAITELGGQVVVMPPPDVDPPLTGLIYAANHGALFVEARGPSFLVSKMSALHRRAEQPHVARFVEEEMGVEVELAEKTWEGQADVCTVPGGRFILTYGVRTVQDACTEVRDRMPVGPSHVLDVEIRDPWFHGDTCLSPITGPDDRSILLVFPGSLVSTTVEAIGDFAHGVKVVPVDEADALAYACNALEVNGTLLVPDGVSRGLVETIEGHGIPTRTLAFEELFGKGGGGPRCLVNVLRGLEADAIPEAIRYETQREKLSALCDEYPASV